MRTLKRNVVLCALAVGMTLTAAAASTQPATHADWPTFGWNIARGSAPTAAMGITPANLDKLQRQQVKLDGTVDSAAIYLHGVTIKGARHDAFFVTTTYGKTIAVDAGTGAVLWEFTPPDYDQFKGTYQITTATPVADPAHNAIYAAAPDGMLRKLAVADGHVEWATSITRLPAREKIPSPLNYFKGHIIATTGGYIGDEPPYQGHVVVLDARTGKLLHVWNALCSDRRDQLLEPRSCPESDAAIWGRAGAVIDPATGNIYVATGNAKWDGKTYFGDAVVELSPDATKLLGNYTPSNTDYLNDHDEDVGSTSPVLAGGPYIVQGGKDGYLRVLDWRKFAGTTPHRGGAASKVRTPDGARLFTAPALWHHAGATWLIVADNAGTAAWALDGSTLQPRWHNTTSGTSPVVADGMAFVYDPRRGGLYVYDAASGRKLAVLPCGPGHWNSPIVADGRIALPEGNANAHQTSGILDIWRLATSTQHLPGNRK